MRYRIIFESRNDCGDWFPDSLDNYGDGFTEADALDITRQLKYYGHRNVTLEDMPDGDD